jgi:hypothetical protein
VTVLALGLALIACSIRSTGGPTPTPTASATATPTPCTTWRVIASPNATGFTGNVLSGVSASSPTDAWAVGESVPTDLSGASPGQQTLIERWDGTAWRLVAGPSADYLHDVAVVSPADVWAVGGVFNYGVGYHPYKPLIEHWNGTQWAVVLSPDTHANAVELDSVAALASNDVWAVGPMDIGAQHIFKPLIERWDGTAWRIVDNPTPAGAIETRLNAIATIPGAKQLWAVGLWRGPAGYGQPLIERWDGAAWQTVPNPSLPSKALGVA